MQREKQKGARREREASIGGITEDLEARSGSLLFTHTKGKLLMDFEHDDHMF